MKKLLKFAPVVAVAFALTQGAQATQITGNIGFTGGVTYNSSSPGNSSAVTSWLSPYVTLDSGAFGGIPTGPLSLVTMAPGSWSFVSGPVANFWSVGGFTFSLTASAIQSQGGTPGVDGFVFVTGIGTVSGNGFDPTVMTWSFTSQDPPADLGNANTAPSWTFSASANSVSRVPDGGATVMLLGLALAGVALLRKKITA